jgi:hypothetical protein
VKLRVEVETGSVYVLDKEAMTWEQQYRVNPSTVLCEESAALLAWPERIEKGWPLLLLSPKLQPFGEDRLVITSDVVRIEEENA